MEIRNSEALVSARDSTSAIRNLYQTHKENRPSFSLRFVCGKVGMKSSGYLSDVIHGKRLLKQEFAEPMAKLFKLSRLQKRYFSSLLQRDHGSEKVDATKLELKLENLRKSLSIQFRPFDEVSVDWFRVFQVYSALGISPGGAKRGELVEFLKPMSGKDIDECLGHLLAKKMVEKKDELFVWTKNAFLLEGTSPIDAHTAYFKSALKHCLESLPRFYSDRSRSLFLSQTVSVKEEAYKEILAKLRADLLEAQSSLESESADNLVFFNVQIYPLR